ncbi:MAG: aryl-sulfate sulfotransferase [Candidatus Rariloculaceae bacterium]
MTRTFLPLLTVAVSSLLLIGCNSAPEDMPVPPEAPPAGDTAGPALSNVSLVQNPNPTVPQAAVLSLTTDEPSRLTINFNDGERSWSVTPDDAMATNHEVPVIGMRAGRVHTITASLQDADGNETLSEAMTFETPPLPDAFPTPVVSVHNPDAMQPGVTVFNINGRWGPTGTSEPANFSPAIIVDDAGEIIWYYLPGIHRVHDIRRLRNGNLAYEVWPGTDGMLEIDMLGNVLNQWQFSGTVKEVHEGSMPVASDAFHHDYAELPNGNFLMMSSENRVIDDWPANYDLDGQTQTANVIGDVIIEMSPSGDVLREWKFHDIVDPYRLGWNARREDYWANHYDGVVEGIVYDWTHGNAIIYEEGDNSFVMSVPYQDAVVKVSMDTGELVWILGTHENWSEEFADKLLTPVGDVGWSYKHHAISHTENGTYLLFDNGVRRSSPPDPGMSLEESYSRAVEYQVNEETMEVAQVWVYGPDDEPFYGRYLGDVDWHADSDTILINVGGRETNDEGQNVPPGQAQRWASLIEVTHEQPAQKVWQMDLKQDDSNWSIYRADRLPSIYP